MKPKAKRAQVIAGRHSTSGRISKKNSLTH